MKDLKEKLKKLYILLNKAVNATEQPKDIEIYKNQYSPYNFNITFKGDSQNLTKTFSLHNTSHYIEDKKKEVEVILLDSSFKLYCADINKVDKFELPFYISYKGQFSDNYIQIQEQPFSSRAFYLASIDKLNIIKEYVQQYNYRGRFRKPDNKPTYNIVKVHPATFIEQYTIYFGAISENISIEEFKALEAEKKQVLNEKDIELLEKLLDALN